MNRKPMTLLIVFLLILSLPLPVSASENLPLVNDYAGLFTGEEAAALEEMAQSLGQEYGMDIVILAVYSLGGQSPQVYADDFFDYNGYGFGENHSGALFLLSLEERDWYISTCGDAIYALTDYGIQTSAAEALPYFSQDDYYNGFVAWLNALPTYFEAYNAGSPIDGYADYSEDYYHGDRDDVIYYEKSSSPNLSLSLIIGLSVAAIVVLIMKSDMNTKRPQRGAASYIADGSYHLRRHQDVFLYSNVTKTPRPKETSSGGGSSVHRSSGGRSHGGGGGKF